MSVRAKCIGCGKALKAPDHLAGRRGRCPACEAVVRFPDNANKTAHDIAAEFLASPTDTSQPDARLSAFSATTVSASIPASFAAEHISTSHRFQPSAMTQGYGFDNSQSSTPCDSAELIPRTSTLRLWLLMLAFVPLAWTIVSPAPPEQDRMAKMFDENPDWESSFEKAKSPEEMFSLFPGERLPGAHLSRNTVIHWIYALASSCCFLLVAKALIPGSTVNPLKLGAFGLFTGTIGIMLMFAFQRLAVSTDQIVVADRGAVAFLTSIVKFFAYSYRCALDNDTGFALSFVGFTCGAGLFEEVCKSMPIAIYLTSHRRSDWRTAALVGFASGIGFGVSEGVMYSSEFYNGVAPGMIYLVRFVSCVMLHAVWSSAVGILMYLNQDHLPGNNGSDTYWQGTLSFLVYYISIAMTLHGLYDTLLKKDMEIAALVVAAISFAWWVWLVNRQIESEYAHAYAGK